MFFSLNYSFAKIKRLDLNQHLFRYFTVLTNSHLIVCQVIKYRCSRASGHPFIMTLENAFILPIFFAIPLPVPLFVSVWFEVPKNSAFSYANCGEIFHLKRKTIRMGQNFIKDIKAKNNKIPKYLLHIFFALCFLLSYICYSFDEYNFSELSSLFHKKVPTND